MPRKRRVEISLPSVDDLFTTQEERDEQKRERVTELPVGILDPFPDHPFHVRDDEEMEDLAKSVGERGVITPIVARPTEDGRYEVVSGHRRLHAAKLAGLDKVPTVVREMDEDAAVIAMVDANLQRECILPSEKAFSYKMKLEAIKRQGRRSDLTSSPVGMKSRAQSLDAVGASAGDSRNTVHRYIRLTELLPELLDLVDEGSMAMRPAVEISYLRKLEQMELYYAIEARRSTPTHAQAIKLRSLSEAGSLAREGIDAIMAEQKPNQTPQFKMPASRLSRFFPPNASHIEIERRIVRALELLERAESTAKR